MKHGLVNFKGLYGDNQVADLPNFIHHETLETRSKVYNWEIKSHLHTDLFQLFIITSGEGVIISENKEYTLKSPCIVTIPTNTVHGFVFQPNIKGDVVTFSEAYLDMVFKNSPKVFLEITKFNLLHFENSQTAFEEICKIMSYISNELVEENAEKEYVIQSFFYLLFVFIYRISMANTSTIDIANNKTLTYFKAFQKSIKQTILETKSIEQYASELNITAVHLNRICQSLVQKSALEIVHEYLLHEAQKYLLNTNYSILEISYFLNFSEPAYFTRMFKKKMGVSPKEFRKNALSPHS